ncbi:MAG: hypothetical protein LBU51_03060 [Bacteroidales bacterium]|jgi:hypothetical protein|nr:hypothetical protein [Bacteroidales bacterium]
MYFNELLFSKFLSVKEIAWLGVDFSLSKLTCEGFDISNEQLHHCISDWNYLIISDQKKYDLRMAFRKPMMSSDLSVISKNNKYLKINNLSLSHISIQNQYSDDEIIKYALSLDFEPKSEFSLFFIVESFDAKSKVASIWVVLMYLPVKSAVLCEKFLEIPSGIGLKNYWARVFYNLIFHIQKSHFLRWKNLVNEPNQFN